MREVPFIGRRSELADLAGALRDASQGRGGVALLAGEPGIGKTRLADELAKLALDDEATVLWGRCWEAGGTPAYWPWTQALRAAVAARGLPAFERAAAGRTVDLAPLLPELIAADRAAVDVADPAQARFRLFDAVTCLLRALSAETPILLVLDDLHSADLSSLHLLYFVARELRSTRVVVLGTYREQEARASAEHMELITRIAREGAIMPLARLGRTEVAELVRSQLGEQTDDELVVVLQQSSEGNPLFLSEMLRFIAASGAPGDRAPRFLPDTVRELIRARLVGVDERTRGLIEIASIFGREFSEPLLSRVAHLARASLREVLEEAARAGLVVELGGDRWSFSHILIREALYASSAPQLRARLHADFAAALELGDDDSPQALAAIAHHRLLGAAESGVRKAIESALVLSRRALRMFAFEDAVSVLESALRLLESEPGETVLRTNALIALGEARIRSGDRVRGKQACRAAAALSRARADAEALAQAALAYGTEITPGEVDPSLVQLLEEALDALGTNDVRLRARVAARLAAARQPAPDTAAPMALAREAIALAREVDDPETLRIVIHFALGALVDYAEPDEIAPLVDESIALATAAGDKTYLLRAHARMVFASLERGDVVRADVAIAEYEALARELPASPQMADALMMQAMRALMQGRFADADELVARARQIRNPLADAFARAGALIHDVASDLVQERADRMLARSREAPEILSALAEVGVDYVHAIFGCAHARLGELDAARRHLDAVPDDATVMTGEPQAQRLLAETAAVVGDVRRAALLESRLRKMARRVMTWGRMGMVCDAPVTRLLGLLAGAQGRHAEATASLEDALARAQAVGIVSLVPRLRLELAQELARGGSGPELERARGLLEDARREAEALGYEAIARAIDALAPRSVPLAPNEAALPFVRTSSSFTLAREGEYYTIECGGAVARLKDSLGLQLLERLVSSPGREFHVLELVRHGGERGEDSDAGELLDERAIGEYRRRLEDLRESAREAEAFGDGERRAKAEREIDALGDELARGVGLGGRQRRAGAASERARINTQRRLRDAIRRIEHQLPDLGRHLSWAVKTGVFCVYSPDRRS